MEHFSGRILILAQVVSCSIHEMSIHEMSIQWPYFVWQPMAKMNRREFVIYCLIGGGKIYSTIRSQKMMSQRPRQVGWLADLQKYFEQLWFIVRRRSVHFLGDLRTTFSVISEMPSGTLRMPSWGIKMTDVSLREEIISGASIMLFLSNYPKCSPRGFFIFRKTNF